MSHKDEARAALQRIAALMQCEPDDDDDLVEADVAVPKRDVRELARVRLHPLDRGRGGEQRRQQREQQSANRHVSPPARAGM